MTADLPDHALELRSLVTSQGTLELSLHDVPVPTPTANEVLVRVEAAPINPSDLGVLIPGADMSTATVTGTPERPIVTASFGARALASIFRPRWWRLIFAAGCVVVGRSGGLPVNRRRCGCVARRS